WLVCLVTEAHGAFEQGQRPAQVALAEGQQAIPPRGQHEAPGVMNCLGNLAPFFREDPTLSECAQFGMARGEPGTGAYGGKEKLTEALVVPRSVVERHGLLEAVDGPTIVTLDLVGLAEGAVRHCARDSIPAGRGECKGTLGCSNGLVRRTPADEML